MHLERSPLKDDANFLNKLYELMQVSETFVIRNLNTMNIHEFTTIILFYF